MHKNVGVAQHESVSSRHFLVYNTPSDFSLTLSLDGYYKAVQNSIQNFVLESRDGHSIQNIDLVKQNTTIIRDIQFLEVILEWHTVKIRDSALGVSGFVSFFWWAYLREGLSKENLKCYLWAYLVLQAF